MKQVVIVAAKRTPVGSFGGVFKDVPAVELGAAVVKHLLQQTGLDPQKVDELIFGNVLKAGLGQNVARQVSVKAGLPIETPSYVVDKVCGSGLKAVELGAQAILAGDAEIVIAGGTENMSQAPYISRNSRWGARMGDVKLVDSMVYDGLTDAFDQIHMGVTAENVAKAYSLTREELDQFSLASQNKAQAAIEAGRFKDEIIPVSVPQRRGDPKIIDTDEYVRFNAKIEDLQKLRPAFDKSGIVTAGNASGINDGAAAVILMTKEKAEELGLKPIAVIKGYASAGIDPTIMGCGPIPATKKALAKAGLTVDDLDLVEANEAFASQAIAVCKDLGLKDDIVNVNGGAIAIGHPIGASGARILVTLLHEMEKRGSRYGLATLCIGGGQGTSLIVERT